MLTIGRRIYFEKSTGKKLLDTGESRGYVLPTTVEQDIETYKVLSERNRKTFDYVELEFGQFAQDFSESIDVRVIVKEEPFVDEKTETKDGIEYQLLNTQLQYGTGNIIVKVDGEIVESGYTFKVNKVVFDTAQIEELTEERIKTVTVSGNKVADLEFSYPNPNDTEPVEPIYQAPLSETVAQLQQENIMLKAQNNALTERTDFHEEVLTEIILTINS